jgi:hypothetical protein
MRMIMAEASADVVGIFGGILALPAGFLRAPTLEASHEMAERLRAFSRRAEIGLAFGIDVGGQEGWAPLARPAESYAYVCDAGRPRLWPAAPMPLGRSEPRALSRCVELCGSRVGVILGREAFEPSLRKELQRCRPRVILALTHLGPTARWGPALEALNAIAPTIVVGEAAEGSPPWVRAPAGWERTEAGGTSSTTLQRYEPIGLGRLVDLPPSQPRSEL